MSDKPQPMQVEAERAIDVAKAHSPSATFWRGDVRGLMDPEKPLCPGCNFNLADDSGNVLEMIGQFRVLTMTSAPEGYMAIVAVESSAVTCLAIFGPAEA